MEDLIRPHTYIALRLPSDTIKLVQAVPNTTISIGKYGSFQTNHILGRPFHLTFEILDKVEQNDQSLLRIVSTVEAYAHIKDDTSDVHEPEDQEGAENGGDGVEYEVINPEGKVLMRTNREIIDDSRSQKLTMADIEALKREATGSGKAVIAKILESHSALDQKTVFGLEKYTLRKAKKYLRRFTVLPVDVPLLLEWILNEKEPSKVMEIREEILALIGSWSNVHYSGLQADPSVNNVPDTYSGRWLVVDETGGLLVAAMAERMGILSPPQEDQTHTDQARTTDKPNGTGEDSPTMTIKTAPRSVETQTTAMSADTNTITLIHANTQPNLALLTYFDFDPTSPNLSHPLHAHLRSLSWLQLLSPTEDSSYAEPEVVPDEVIQTMKGGKKSNYYRKRRRWEKVKAVVDQTRAGGFDGLIVASVMDPTAILHNTIALLRGGAQVVVYSPNIEPLAELADYYSTARRTAFQTDPPSSDDFPDEDFPLNPTLLLNPAIYTARCRNWQVLPGRTHPLMTGRGGAEGYVFTATRVLPAEGKVEARGSYKRRKLVDVSSASPASQTVSEYAKNDEYSMAVPP
ncbi:tRNA (adenine(58)-N(1))-methyltransferase non-catalytic subunit trm6 [Xylographa soralifera]|nr:tRNA (adenine(58)-N(1))-methyltransferase non-catalytic subunit trm6 [Xylographa soralifera]